jgi:retinol dehydrogenase 12
MRGKTVSGPAGRPSSARRRFSGSRAWALESSSSPAITPEQDADTIIYLASSPEVANVTGRYFIQRKAAKPSAAARDDAVAKTLWERSEALAGSCD